MAWLMVLVIGLNCWILLEKFLSLSHDAKEPPIIPQTLPYVGHLLGTLRHGSRYYTQIRSVLAELEVIYADTTRIQLQISFANMHIARAAEQDLCRDLGGKTCGTSSQDTKSIADMFLVLIA